MLTHITALQGQRITSEMTNPLYLRVAYGRVTYMKKVFDCLVIIQSLTKRQKYKLHLKVLPKAKK